MKGWDRKGNGEGQKDKKVIDEGRKQQMGGVM